MDSKASHQQPSRAPIRLFCISKNPPAAAPAEPPPSANISSSSSSSSSSGGGSSSNNKRPSENEPILSAVAAAAPEEKQEKRQRFEASSAPSSTASVAAEAAAAAISTPMSIDTTQNAGPQLFDPAAGQSRFQVADWERVVGANAPPLPPDGRYWEDEKTKTKRHTHDDDRYFGADYMRDLIKRRAAIEADLVYDFVTLVAGASGRATSAKQFWRATATGGRAVELIFDNLYGTEDPKGNSSRLSAGLGLKEETIDQIRQKARQELEAALQNVDDRKRDTERFGGDKQSQNLAAIIDIMPRLELLLKLEKDSQGKLTFSKDLFNITQELRKKLTSMPTAPSVAAAPAPTQPPAPPAPPPPQQPPPLLSSALPPVSSSSSSSPLAAAAASTTSAAANIFTGEGYVADLDNPKLVLLRAMLRNDGKPLTDSFLKAWDAIYYNGRFFNDARNAEKRERDQLVDVAQRLRAARYIERFFSRDSASESWRDQPLNTGLLFVSDEFRYCLLHAYHRIRNVCGKQEVSLIDLMTHENVYVYFAGLVAALMDQNNGSRYTTVASAREVNENIAARLNAFEYLQYNAQGFLVFSKTYDASKEAQRQYRDELRRQEFEATARYHSDRYAPGSSGGTSRPNISIPKMPSGKKPIYSAAAARTSTYWRP